jgi:hypothetical protein
MEILEFFRIANIVHCDRVRTIVDLRPFGERQDEALYYYLHEIIEARMKEGGMFTNMRIIIRWDGKAILAVRTLNLFRYLENRGIPIESDSRAKSATA